MRAVVAVAGLSLLMIMLSGTRPALAQQRASAGIYGSVTDSQGAVVPGATVTLLHVTTNQERTATTSQDGEYLFPLLPVGEYRVSVEQSGFKKYTQTGLLLQVNDNVKVDVRLHGMSTSSMRARVRPKSDRRLTRQGLFLLPNWPGLGLMRINSRTVSCAGSKAALGRPSNSLLACEC